MKTKFYLADEIRPEASGKQTLLGLFADDVLVIDLSFKPPSIADDIPPAADRLGFLFSISDCSVGNHKLVGYLETPTGNKYSDASIDTEFQILEAGKSAVLALQTAPFTFKYGSGTYKWVLLIDGEEHIHTFDVRFIGSPVEKASKVKQSPGAKKKPIRKK